MALLDHFHPPLFSERHWEAFHARWAVAIADALNGSLPEDYFAETRTHVGSPIWGRRCNVRAIRHGTTGEGDSGRRNRGAHSPRRLPLVFPARARILNSR